MMILPISVSISETKLFCTRCILNYPQNISDISAVLGFLLFIYNPIYIFLESFYIVSSKLPRKSRIEFNPLSKDMIKVNSKKKKKKRKKEKQKTKKKEEEQGKIFPATSRTLKGMSLIFNINFEAQLLSQISDIQRKKRKKYL